MTPATSSCSTPTPSGAQDVGGDGDVADLGDLPDGAHALAEERRHHVLGDGVLGPSDEDVAQEGT